MDIGVHILGSVTSNVNGLSGQKELTRDRSEGERSSKLARTTREEVVEVEEEEDFSSSSLYYKTMSSYQDNPLMRSDSESRKQEHMLSFSDKQEAFDFSKCVGLDYSSYNKNSLSPFLQQIPPSYSKSSGGYGYGGMMMNMNMQGNFTSVKGPFTLTQWAELELQALIFKYIIANVPIPSSLLISIKKSFYPFGSLPHSSFGWGSFHLGLAGGNMDPEPGRCRRTDGKKWRCSKDAVLDQKYCERHINRGRHRSRKHVEVQSSHTAAPAGGCNRASSLVSGGQCIINHSTTDSLLNSVQNPQGVSVSPVIHQKHRDNNNNNNNPFEFGHISTDSLLNSNSSKTYGSSSFFGFSSNQAKPEELKSDWTQLSMSIPIPTAQENIVLSPLRLSREETRLESAKKVSSWIPISWGNSLGGPLGEVLNSTTSSPTLGSSPTEVLQKSTFCSVSNSSSLSSPVAESYRNNGDYFHYTT